MLISALKIIITPDLPIPKLVNPGLSDGKEDSKRDQRQCLRNVGLRQRKVEST
jgi:hypothetical protein